MTIASKLIAIALSSSFVAAAPAAAQMDSIADAKRQLATLRDQEESVRQQMGQLQLDALIGRLNRPEAPRRDTRTERTIEGERTAAIIL